MKPNLFGTDGIRAIVGSEPLTAATLPIIGQAIAQWAKKKYKMHPSILLAHDTRSSCYFIKAALKSGLLRHTIKLYDVLAAPTPTACLLIRENKLFDCGIIITASHNPYQYNGIKIIDSSGNKISTADEEEICSYCANPTPELNYETFGTDYRVIHAGAHYLDILSKRFPAQFLSGKTIVLDCANGAATSMAPHIFRLFGAKVIAIHNTPTGININKDCGALAPESLIKAVLHSKADAGFAFDGDADRVIAVNKKGYIKDGDDIVAILMSHPTIAPTRAIVGTHYSNQGLEKFVKKSGKQFIRTDIGDKHVSTKLTTENLPLGGEPAGHVIIKHYLDSSDGIFTALMVLETAHLTNNWNLESFERYPQVLLNVPIKIKKDLKTEPMASIIQQTQKTLKDGRLIVRYSGTENVLRIMLEAPKEDQAMNLANGLAQQLGKALEM